jgi:alcohol dehydrogenase
LEARAGIEPARLGDGDKWSRNIKITTRLVDAVTTPFLLRTVRSKKLEPRKLITRRFPLGEIMKAYETFDNAAKERSLKVVLTNS